MTPIWQHVRHLRDTGDGTALCEAIPYCRFLGLRTELGDRGVVAVMPFAPHVVGNPTLPAIHGGALGALLEASSILQVLWAADTLLIPKTINLTVSYLRSGRPLETRARGVITRNGRRVVHVDAVAWQDDPARPIASATLNFLIEPVEAGA